MLPSRRFVLLSNSRFALMILDVREGSALLKKGRVIVLKRKITNYQEAIEEINNKSIFTLSFLFPEVAKAQKKGEFYYILCVFHQEKTPSLAIRTRRNYFHCYGCGEGGRITEYYMLRKNVSFFKAVVDLARIFKIKLHWSNQKPDL